MFACRVCVNAFTRRTCVAFALRTCGLHRFLGCPPARPRLCAACAAACAPRWPAPPPSVPRVPLGLGRVFDSRASCTTGSSCLIVARRARFSSACNRDLPGRMVLRFCPISRFTKIWRGSSFFLRSCYIWQTFTIYLRLVDQLV